ncbi:MAG: hypothetical protein K2Q09_05305, partial [Phycisphaerales bacterium]|nr:hypothetical protein [Phycisphaerales bacterium]
MLRLPLGNGGIVKAGLWAGGLLLAAVVVTYAAAWVQCVAAPNATRSTTAWTQGPLEAVRVDSAGGAPGVERIWWSDTYGWPFRSVGAVFAQTNTAGGGPGTIALKAGIDLGERRDLNQRGLTVPWALPLVPVNGLFAADVAFSFVLLGLLLFGRAVVQDRRRSAAGRCVQCAYPLGVGGRCPECGWQECIIGVLHANPGGGARGGTPWLSEAWDGGLTRVSARLSPEMGSPA